MWKNIHNWKRIYSLLLALVLMSGSLVACAPTNSENDINNGNTSNISKETGDLEKSFNDVENTHKEFQTSLDNFMKKVAATKDDPNRKKSFNSSEVDKKLIGLEKKVTEYKDKIVQTRKKQNLDPIFNDINTKIQDIRKITDILKDGLGKILENGGTEPIGKIQIDLGIVQNQKSDNFGRLGETTANKINDSLKKNSEEIKRKITDLGQATGQPSSVTPDADELTKKRDDLEKSYQELVARVDKHEEEIKNLRNLNNKLPNIYQDLHQLKIFLLILVMFVFIIFVVATIIFKLLIEELKSLKRKKPTQEINNTASLTGNYDTQEFIVAVSDKVGNISKELDQISNLSKKQQDQIIKLQQNQQVKTQYNNNANNRKLISQLEDEVKEISRQLQEISNWWKTQWRNLENQINQPQQNRQVMTSSNVARSYEAPRTTNYPARQVIAETQMNRQTSTNQYSGSSGLDFISTYEQNPRLLLKNAIEVSEADQSIDQRRLGGAQGVILQKVRRGNYWILNEGGTDYVVPKDNIKINEYNLETVRNLFECQGYRSEYSGFKLIKPAIVSYVSRGEVWQLVELGVLQFY